MRKYAQAERHALCDTALRLGPDAPTLCVGWNVRDLMAHLAMRERRPEALGILVPQVRDASERTRERYALRPFEDLVDMVRKGPHEFSPFRIPAVDAHANLQEYFIHHEDILRAQLPAADQDGVRVLGADLQNALYDALPTAARMTLRHSAMRVAALCPGHAPLALNSPLEPIGEFIVAGQPSEVLLHLAGRMSFVEFEGEPDDINRFVAEPRGI
ncbi:TIGR03085 family metal-binding protein [Dermacoccus nishinomiyaensis]|uniref:TIGR03085 family metal-binding protein n=1 Tax=Dermacoccus nishinomiyaensis TaxID=1274 RepID=UPI0013F42DE2|nr:TIGR03085 family metal-binding protein [Dermacoccus nishinomiyaensis]MCG7428495.1 TIGR03085 family metal-binding protein [Dermacoccus nishinomiyaensis]NHC30480.1 TIGR03085 family protein [Dermacoccus nishinomiyaensis]